MELSKQDQMGEQTDAPECCGKNCCGKTVVLNEHEWRTICEKLKTVAMRTTVKVMKISWSNNAENGF